MLVWIEAVVGAVPGAAGVTPQGRKMRFGRAVLGVIAGIAVGEIFLRQWMRLAALQVGADQIAATGAADADSIMLAANAMHAAAVALVAGVTAGLLCAGGRHPNGRAGEIEDEERLRADLRDRIERERPTTRTVAV